MRRARPLEIPLSPFRSPVDNDRDARFAAWLRALAGVSGCYAIRDDDTGRVLYCGMSGGKGDSTGDLYTIITRHFQRSMVRGGERPAGTYYDRFAVEVAYVEAPRALVPEIERALIQALRPVDNLRLAYVEIEDDEDLTEDDLDEAIAELEGERIPF